MIASYVSVFEDILSLDLRQSTSDVHVCLASTVQQSDQMLDFRRMNLSRKLGDKFREVLQNFLTDFNKTWAGGGHVLYPYSGDSKPEEYEVEYLRADTNNYEFMKEQIAPLQAYQDFLFFQENDKQFIKNIRFYVLVVKPLSNSQEPILFYRFYTRRQLLKQSRFIGAVFRDTNEYDLVEEPTLQFDDTVDCISRGDDFFILRKENFHLLFRFLEELEKSVDLALDTIHTSLKQGKVPIEGYDDFVHDCKRHRVKMNMLTAIAKKPYIKNLTPARIRPVVQLLGRDVLGDDFITMFEHEQKLLYDTKYPWALLKLLNDNYLWSQMTDQGYDVSGKREL